LTVTAKGANTVTLPVAVTLVKDLPAKLTLTPALPELRGTSRSTFEYQLTLKNESGKRIVASLAATAPPNFEVSFTEQYGSQELNAVPLDANQSKDVKLKVRPPNTVAPGMQKVVARATAEDATVTADLGLDITGTPKIELAGREGLLSARAAAGQETTIPVVVTNTGTAPAEAVEMSGSGPSGWKVEADPKVIDRIPPNENKEVQFRITPTAKAVAGDYVTSMRASARGESASRTFRVAVATSTQWGIIGVGIIGVALLVLVGAVARFGRR
ncbi:MAG: NEW3 domain-containing protein, partial [Burkholderiales bacterium]